MGTRGFGRYLVDLPEEWADEGTMTASPRIEGRPTANLTVKRRPAPGRTLDQVFTEYRTFIDESLSNVSGLEVEEVMIGPVPARLTRFRAVVEGRAFSQTTLLWIETGEEVSATVSRLAGDPTSDETVERLLRSFRPIGPVAGFRGPTG